MASFNKKIFNIHCCTCFECYFSRQKQNKFLGRTIQHEWIVDETSQQKEWYKGTVMSVISGNDGKLNAVYEVLYDGDAFVLFS
jgi:hypothetical protein